MKQNQIIDRTKVLAINIVKMTNELPRVSQSQILSNQIVRSGTSVGANYSAACRSKSAKDFIYKLKIVEEELDETIYWLDVIGETHHYMKEKNQVLRNEAVELIKIIGKSLSTVRRNQKKRSKNNTY